MRVSVLGSIFLHVFILLFTVLSLPLFNNNDLEMPPVIQVELIEIAEKTNVPQISKKIEEQKEPIEKKKEETKLNQPISKPKDEKSNEKVKDPSDEEKIEKTKLEEKMIQNMPVRKPEVKKKDKFDPLKLAELIDKQKDTKMDNPEEIIEKDYEALDSTPSLDKRLTLSEEDAIRAQFMQCWSIPLGIPYDDTMIVKIKIYLNTDGSLLNPPEVVQHERMNKPSEKYFRTLAESALRAVRRCDPIKVPDVERYDNWKNLQLNFDPREILRLSLIHI